MVTAKALIDEEYSQPACGLGDREKRPPAFQAMMRIGRYSTSSIPTQRRWSSSRFPAKKRIDALKAGSIVTLRPTSVDLPVNAPCPIWLESFMDNKDCPSTCGPEVVIMLYSRLFRDPLQCR